MVGVPLDGVDSQVMAIVCLHVLSRVSLGAEMDLTFFCSNEEEISFELVEIEAHSSSKTEHEGLLLVIGESLVVAVDESKLNNLFWFKLVLHQSPVGNSSITGDGVEVQILGRSLFIVPSDLPNRICMLVCSNSRLIYWFVITL